MALAPSPTYSPAYQKPDRPVTTPFDDWPGYVEFGSLGEFEGRTTVHGHGSIEVGFFRAEINGRQAIYAASSRPHVVGMGANKDLALADWLDELFYKWSIAKGLRRPYGAATENDIEAMGVFFGSAPDDTSDTRY